MRMFAGPNGSGKSTIKELLPASLLGVYINADDMEQAIQRTGYLDLADFGVETTAAEILDFFLSSSFLASAGLMAAKVTFTFETVMSGADKIVFLKTAQQAGFRTYLYYVATEDPEINISRVRHRVKVGGHMVPEDKIVSITHQTRRQTKKTYRPKRVSL